MTIIEGKKIKYQLSNITMTMDLSTHNCCF